MLHILGVWPELAPQLLLSANKATTMFFHFAEAQALSANYNINLGSFYYAQKKQFNDAYHSVFVNRFY
jgi:hypothetical protein